MDNRFDTYLKALAGVYRDGGTEHTGRTALENLLNSFAADAMARGIAIQHEPQRETYKGAPDFKVKRQGRSSVMSRSRKSALRSIRC